MKKIIILSGFSVILSACTQSTPAEITDISNATSSSRTVLSSYVAPPKNISLGNQNVSNRFETASVSEPLISNASSSITPDADNHSDTDNDSDTDNNKVMTTKEQIVYKRNYDDIPKGGYQGNAYKVKRGDTLFYIAWVTGNDYRALAAKNNIQEPYALQEGQVLNVGGGQTVVVTEKKTTFAEIKKKDREMSAPSTISPPKSSLTEPKMSVGSSTVGNVSWRWPARGKMIEKFSKATKGIDIAGSLGDRVLSAADGRVVYAGNALPGYGNLIIIKHNDDYLTAYAHNQKMLVKEQQAIKAGQQIATMGATGTSSVRLHFEIRYRAQSVDPLKYLPVR